METYLLLVTFFGPVICTRMLDFNWWIALLAGSVACGSTFTLLRIISKALKKQQEEANDMTAMERAEIAM